MVEVIFAVMILAVGLLGMAGTTALVVKQITVADLSTERSAAMQTTVEHLKAIPFDQLMDGSDSVGIYEVSWSVSKPSGQWAVVEVVTTGPGMAAVEGGGFVLRPSVSDSFTHRILR
jgi:Tfp pilus assembly protein PilV